MADKNAMIALIRERFIESASIKDQIQKDEEMLALIADISQKVIDAIKAGNKVMLCGNGGSAADSQHIAAELVGKFYLNRAPLPAMSLTVNTSSITAVGNDFHYDDIFEKQLRGLGKAGDVVIGISTSGNSGNVIQAFEAAKEIGITTVAFTGQSGGKIKGNVDYCLCIPSSDTPRIQEGHITAGHIMCEIVEKALFEE